MARDVSIQLWRIKILINNSLPFFETHLNVVVIGFAKESSTGINSLTTNKNLNSWDVLRSGFFSFGLRINDEPTGIFDLKSSIPCKKNSKSRLLAIVKWYDNVIIDILSIDSTA